MRSEPMKALVNTATQQMTYRAEPMAALLASDEVRLRIDAVGICGSDMHAYHGHDPRRVPPIILGHEFAGVVVEGAYLGKRFTGNPLIACGVCDYCEQGRSNLCSNRSMVGMTRPGAYAEFMTIPFKCLIEIPPDMDATRAALTEPAATALHALHMAQRASVRPLQEAHVLVIGGGAIGMFMALLLRNYGVRDVQVGETNALRRASIARHADAHAFDPSTEVGPKEGGCDVVFDCVGSKHTRIAALKAVRQGGVMVHIGLQDWSSEIDMRKLTLAEITLIGTYTYTMADLRATVAALHGDAFGDCSWVEARALADGAAAFADLHEGKSASAKIVLLPH